MVLTYGISLEFRGGVHLFISETDCFHLYREIIGDGLYSFVLYRENIEDGLCSFVQRQTASEIDCFHMICTEIVNVVSRI